MAMPMAACVNAAVKRCWFSAASRWASETRASWAWNSVSWRRNESRASITTAATTMAATTSTVGPNWRVFSVSTPATAAEIR